MPQPEMMLGSYVLSTMFFPKLALEYAPHSPFATGLSWSQSGTKLRLASFQDRLVDDAMRLALFSPSPYTPVSWASRYLPAVNLTAVLPSPKRSYAAATRGVMLWMSTPSSSGRMNPLGMKRLKPTICSGKNDVMRS